MVAGLGAENSCDHRFLQAIGCEIYVVSNQNKRFNTLRLASNFLQMTHLVKAFYSKGV